MVHYTCDQCKRPLDPTNELRYVVRMEVYASLGDTDDGVDDDRDHLQEIQELLERMDEGSDNGEDEQVYEQLRFDLCGECRKRFLRDPMGRQLSSQFDFSNN